MTKEKNEIIIYEDKDGITKVSVKFINEDIWLTQNPPNCRHQSAYYYCTIWKNMIQNI